MPDTSDADLPASNEPTEQKPIEATSPLESANVLRSRVDALEIENVRLLDRYAAQLQNENERIRRTMTREAPGTFRPDALRPNTLATDSELTAPITAARLARDLVAVEDHLAEMEQFAAVGNAEAAAMAKVAAATRACGAFRRLCDDPDFRQLLMEMPQHAAKLADRNLTMLPDQNVAAGSFRDVEMTLLELIGLTRPLAYKHVDAALEAFRADPSGAVDRTQNPARLLDDLRTLRDATCQSADLLAMGVRRDASRSRWRKILTYGLGGTVIIAANGLSVAVLGPVGVAVSQAVGSAAVGVAVPLSG